MIVHLQKESARETERAVNGWERENESMEGIAILAYSAALSPLVCHLFFPFFRSWALDHFSFPSPQHSTQFCHPAKEMNQRTLSQSPHFSFVSPCLALLVVRFSPDCLSTLQFDPRGLWCHNSSKGSWDLNQGRMSLCASPILVVWMAVLKRSFFPFSRELPLFGESLSCFKKSALPF